MVMTNDNNKLIAYVNTGIVLRLGLHTSPMPANGSKMLYESTSALRSRAAAEWIRRLVAAVGSARTLV